MSTHVDRFEHHTTAPETTKTEQLESQVHHLTSALVSRAVIEQAKGVLMQHLGIDAETAFQVLVRWSSHTNTKLALLAGEVTDSTAHGGSAVAALVLDMAHRSRPASSTADADEPQPSQPRREVYADHGRPSGGRTGGELRRDTPPPPRR